MRDEAGLLEEINRELPAGVDWKRGAETYVRDLVARGGRAFRQWHLTKPFLGEPLAGEPLHGDSRRPAVDPYVTHHELHTLLNVLRAADPPPRSRILDVGCGPGWTSHYLGKMGYTVLGFDLSGEMLELARERVAAEPFPPYPKERLDVRFLRHDIEVAPLGADAGAPYDLALLDSVLHHFLNPVAALRHLSESLVPQAIVAVVEALRPEGAPDDPANLEIMRRYHTLERPYTASQMADILRLSGFVHHVELAGVNGLFTQAELARPLAPGPTGTILASRERRALARWMGDGLVYGNFHEEETDARGPFRWARPESSLLLDGRELALSFVSLAADLGQERHEIFVSVDGQLVTVLKLTDRAREAVFRPGPLPAGTSMTFHSSFSFCPKLLGMSADPRVLAFQLRTSPA